MQDTLFCSSNKRRESERDPHPFGLRGWLQVMIKTAEKSQSAHSAVTHTCTHKHTHSHTLKCKTALLGQMPLCGCLVHPGCTSGMSSSKQSERSLSHYFDAICEWQVGITTAWSQSFLRQPWLLDLNVFWVCLKAAWRTKHWFRCALLSFNRFSNSCVFRWDNQIFKSLSWKVVFDVSASLPSGLC